MAAAGQTINDRILAAKHSLAGQGLAKAVCKATTEEIIGPKKKHLDYLLHCTNEPNVSIPTLANLLIERTLNPNWCVVYKSLITIHHLMCYGNERFTQYLASSNSNFQLSNFLDKTGVQGYDMSPFIRRYAKYLSEKSVSYRTVAFDFCKVKRGKDGGTLRTMSGDKLLKTLPTLQSQVDHLLEFDCTSQDLNNGVINACFMLLFRDLIRLFACYNDGVINLLEKYFDMNKKQARNALDLYKKFLIRMDRVAEFLKTAENVGIDKGDIPDLAKAPSSLLEALEGHLASLEGRKPGSGGTTPTSGSTRVNVAAAVNALSTTSSAFGTAANGNGLDEKMTQKLLEEEEAAMEKFKTSAAATNPFAASTESSAEETPNILDLFGCAAPAAQASPAPVPAATISPVDAGKASDDLLQLAGNPFANMLNGGAIPSFPQASSAPLNPMGSAGLNGSQPPSTTSPFVTDNSFNNMFGSPAVGGGAALFGDVLQPVGGTPGVGVTGAGGKVITSDLDASLANLASNLDFGTAKNKAMVGGGVTRGPPMGGGPPMGFNPFPPQQVGVQPSMPTTSLDVTGPSFQPMVPSLQPSFPGISLSASTPAFPSSSPTFPKSTNPLSPTAPPTFSDPFSSKLAPASSSSFADFGSVNGSSSSPGGFPAFPSNNNNNAFTASNMSPFSNASPFSSSGSPFPTSSNSSPFPPSPFLQATPIPTGPSTSNDPFGLL